MLAMEMTSLISQSFPAADNAVYLNTGSVGPLSTITSDSLQENNLQELTEGRARTSSYYAFRQVQSDLRRAFATLTKADPDEIALTHHTTEGMNIAAHGLQWHPGDEVITTDLEHPGGLFPVYILAQRYGVTVKVVEIPADLSPDAIVARLEAAITPRTRLLALSHVAWNTGMCLPLKEIVAMSHRHHALVLVDGAQSIGAIPLDLPAIGVDFYAMPGQKWLCGPEGTGALYVRKDRLSLLSPTFVGYRTMGDAAMYDLSGSFMLAPNSARRYEVATVYRPSMTAMLANLVWLEETIGWDWIYSRIAQLAGYARSKLSQVAGISIITPPGTHAGLVTFNLEGYDPPRVMTKLAEDNIVLRYIGQPYTLRISTGFYNTEADIDQLVAALEVILAGDPEALPLYEV